MPFQVKLRRDGFYYLWRIKQKNFVKTRFRTRESAISQGKNYMRYRGEKPYVKGNKILSR